MFFFTSMDIDDIFTYGVTAGFGALGPPWTVPRAPTTIDYQTLWSYF